MNDHVFVFKKIGSVSSLAETGIKPAPEYLLTALFLNHVPDDKGDVGMGNTDPVRG